MNNEILEFVQRRFKKDCNWIDGNCYYFAVILKNRFPDGKIYFDVIWKHFVFWYQGQFYDWTGIYDWTDVANPNTQLIDWDKFDEYDSLEKYRVIRDCIY